MSTQPKDVGLELSRTELYPPHLSDGMEIVQFSTTVPGTDSLSFDYTVNGIAAIFQGVTWSVGQNRGYFLLDPDFMAFYGGAWPVRFEVRAFRNGTQVDSAVALLHDTRKMVVHRCEASIGPNPTRITPEVMNTASASAVFFDDRGVELPQRELSWELLLPQALPGVVVAGKSVQVQAEAAPGEVALVVRERSGLEQALSLTLVPGEDIGIKLSADDLYPPLISDREHLVHITDTWPDRDAMHYTFSVNGHPNGHGGVGLRKLTTGFWFVVFNNTFIHNVEGGWPVQLRLEARIDKSIIDSKVLRLHDTRTMECARVEMELSPSDTVVIPQEWYAAVAAAPRLYDAAGIRLPHEEVDWHVEMPVPVEGVTLQAHIILVSPEASPGRFDVTIHGPNGLSQTRVVTLV